MTQTNLPNPPSPMETLQSALPTGCLMKLYKNMLLIMILLVVGGLAFAFVRDGVYKIRPNERGIHLRGGQFIGIDQPGWHFQIPFVDTVIGITVSERQGMIEEIAAMTADDVTMDISLLYTFRVEDPATFALEVTNPEAIVSGFVEATLRDVVNTKPMADVMRSRAEINQEVLQVLTSKEAQYGVKFILVQVQSASPPSEVVSAIKDLMVSVQLQQQAEADAAQMRTLADSEFYAAQKRADAEAYQITELAKADAERIRLVAEAQALALRATLAELEASGDLAENYIQVLLAQELSENSKWVFTNGDVIPVMDLEAESTAATETP
jgi:modulator of FtsH protease HflK